jgi:hypothetical protein
MVLSPSDFEDDALPPLTEEEKWIEEEVKKWRNSDKIKAYDAEDYEEHVFSDEEDEDEEDIDDEYIDQNDIDDVDDEEDDDD